MVCVHKSDFGSVQMRFSLADRAGRQMGGGVAVFFETIVGVSRNLNQNFPFLLPLPSPMRNPSKRHQIFLCAKGLH